MSAFVENLPKAELHVHLEGTLEPELLFDLAQKNGIELPYATPREVVAAYNFHDLPSFLAIYYKAMEVLVTQQDFYDLAMQYFTKAAEQNVIYVEPFFDPQAHTARGVEFGTMIEGIHAAQVDAQEKLGVHSNLIMCFLRDVDAESAQLHLQMAEPYLDWIVGVGLDSDERDNPPAKFADVFRDARAMGLKLTMHCDVNQKDIVDHMWECLNDIKVDRIDHGVNALDDEQLLKTLVKTGMGLTICPISNRFVVQTLTGDEIRAFLTAGVKATVNSDDPAYFRGYMNENLQALADDADFSDAELAQLTRNAFDICWAEPKLKASMQDRLETYLATAM